MKQALLFLGLSLLMGTIALFALYGYDSVSIAIGAEIATAHAAAVENTTSDTKTPFAEGCDKCHGNEPAYQEWRSAGHSHALVNLIEGPYELQTSCLSCQLFRAMKPSAIGSIRDTPIT